MVINWRQVMAGCWRQLTSAAWVILLALVITVASYYTVPPSDLTQLEQAGIGDQRAAPASTPAENPEATGVPVTGEVPVAKTPPGVKETQGEQVYFSMADPEGDDRGPGMYQYPLHRTFAAHDGLFDLTRFQVSGDAGFLYFDLTFRQITNPWHAPEGFFHQRADIYIDALPRAGRTDTYQEGAYVRFAPQYAWDYMVRVAPWGGGGVYAADGRRLAMAVTAEDEEPKTGESAAGEEVQEEQKAVPVPPPGPAKSPLERMMEELQKRQEEKSSVAMGVVKGNTIRVAVPRGILGGPGNSWRYYVLVGAYDGFGPDNYRLVMEHPGDWVLGGGQDGLYDPNVLDLLAPSRGRFSQRYQLASFNPLKGRLATLYPVGGSLSAGGIPWVTLLLVSVIILTVFMAYRWARPWMQNLGKKPPAQ